VQELDAVECAGAEVFVWNEVEGGIWLYAISRPMALVYFFSCFHILSSFDTRSLVIKAVWFLPCLLRHMEGDVSMFCQGVGGEGGFVIMLCNLDELISRVCFCKGLVVCFATAVQKFSQLGISV
jgi:hypothetical protein